MKIVYNFYHMLVVFVCLSIILYGVFRSTALIIGPTIEINESEKVVYQKTPLVVSGTVKRSTQFYINDREIYLTRLGVFSEILPVSTGFTTIKFHAIGKSGRNKTIYRNIIISSEE